MKNSTLRRCLKIAAICLLGLLCTSVFADGIYRNGIGTRAMALGGADVAYASDSLGAMAANPAGLGFLTGPELDLVLNGATASGEFNKAGSGGHLSDKLGVFPDAAFAMPLGNTALTAGISFVTDTALDSDWHYNDPTTSGGSYGSQRDRSQIIVFRSALGLGYQLNSQWSFGANVGLDYNENRLQAPYIFQTGALAGAKVLLDMTTTGLGWNGQVGALFRTTTNLQFGVSYKSPTTIFSEGTAGGAVNNYPFQYNSQVKNVLPQVVTAGVSWKFCNQWRATAQLDWINWADAFKELPVSLSSGHNSLTTPFALPGAYNDYVPLHWANEFVYRAGLEYNVTTNLVVRGGYCYGGSPVPSQTLTPLTAVIMEHTLTAGLGYHWKRCDFGVAYQWDIPVTRGIGGSGLLDGEYSNSSVRIGLQTFSVSTAVHF